MQCLGFSSQQLLLLWSTGSRCGLQLLWCTDLVTPGHVESSRTRYRTHASCTGRQILNQGTTREVRIFNSDLDEAPAGRWHRHDHHQISGKAKSLAFLSPVDDPRLCLDQHKSQQQIIGKIYCLICLCIYSLNLHSEPQ